MPETQESKAHPEQVRDPLDDALASFTDQALAGGSDQRSALSDQPDLRLLEDMVLRLQRNLPTTPVSASVRRQMQSRLATHWAAEGPCPKTISLGDRLRSLLPKTQGWQSSAARQRAWMLRTAAVAVVIVLAAILIFSPSLGENLSGTAGLQGGAAPLLAVLLIAAGLVAAAWWNRRHKP